MGARADEVFGVSISRWHWGKIAILWAWGGGVVALLLAGFLALPATQSPVSSTFMFLTSVVILVALSSVTWLWLGGKEEK